MLHTPTLTTPDTTQQKLDASFGVALQRLAERHPRQVNTAAPAPVAAFDLDPDLVADVRADLNDSREDSDGYYTDAQVERALQRFVQSELESLLEDVGNKFFDIPAHRREKFLGEPANRQTESRWERADANED